MGSLFFKNKRLVAVTVLVIAAIGISAVTSIARQEDPAFSKIFATVVTPYPGADPARVESLVTEKIEEQLRGIAELETIESISRAGMSLIQLELDWDTPKSEIEQLWSQVRDALADAAKNFPPGVPEPAFDDDRVGAFTAISALTPTAGAPVNLAITRRYAELLQTRLQTIPGTRRVDLFGAPQEEILVAIDPHELAALGLTVADVSRAIALGDSKVRAGQIRGSELDVLIEIEGEIDSIERIRSIPVIGNTASRIVRVADIADVRREVRKPPENLAFSNGRPAILIASRIEDNLKVDDWMLEVDSLLGEFEAELPHGIEHRLVFNQVNYTWDRLGDVFFNLMVGMTLVVLVLFITQGVRAAAVVAVNVPLATLISLYGLHLLGIPIHQMSVTGLIVALGLLVDVAIVMTDDIRRRLRDGTDRATAIARAVRRLTVPLLASTVTTGLAFAPLLLLPGPPGDFLGSIGVAVVLMLVASFTLALTVTPALAGLWLAEDDAGSSRSAWSRGLAFKPVAGIFDRSMKLALANPMLAILAALILPVIGFGAAPTLKEQFFPGVDRDQLYVQLKLPSGSSIAETERAVLRADHLIHEHTGVVGTDWVLGSSAPNFYYNMVRDQDGESSFAEALVKTATAQATEEVLPLLQRTLDRDLPNARVTVRGLVQGPPVVAPVELRVVGPDLDVLRDLGDRIRNLMADVPEVMQARTQIEGGAPKFTLKLDEEKVRVTGLALGEVASQLEAALEGATGGSLVESSEELPVRVRVGEAARAAVDVLRALHVVGPGAREEALAGGFPGIPIAALGTIRTEPSKTPIFRRNGERVNTVRGYVYRSVLPEEALKRVRERIATAGFAFPPGYRLEVGGDSDAREKVMADLIAPVGVILVLTFVTIILTFNSFRLSALAGLVMMLSVGLSLLSLAAFQFPLGVMAVIGVIGSIGVSINAAIIIVTSLQNDSGAAEGDVTRIRQVVMGQSRHIVSTTVTTFGGFLPLILGGGGFWPPFAVAIAGGVLLSTLVSFYFTPPAFLLLARTRRRMRESGRADRREKTTAHAMRLVTGAAA
jgi:multidrug efflux pump subunit AcrB